ncbi:signal peptide containing protein [Theileria equi strain WA]|uniref:Signal peptide containing protein n=1 Tax=Theileria equi strain WA TaxID=1537102 RepID=L1LD32_THEEQ|nr:signal peptide containing protein [Theileria equi strain WA]EKX73332.1 signal peptide containing protein [Theileria equi strain WA]|eukprot:XP_004832784.1 signal peptide containing protein [Theileria equi strain WA]
MKVFSILLTTCLLGLCHCKNSRLPTDRFIIEVLDDYTEDEVVNYHPKRRTRKSESSGKRQVWDMANGTVYEVEYTLSSARRYSDEKVADVAVDESPVPQTSRHTTTLDLANPDKDECEFFEYPFAGNAVQLIVPKRNIAVTRLVDGEEEVYVLSTGEMFQYANSYLNTDGTPELVLVTLRTLSGTSRRDYVKTENGWTFCTYSNVKIKSLKTRSTWISDFNIDLSLETSTDQCTIFETELLGVTTKHFFPKPGYLAKGVKDVNGLLWSSSKPIYTEGTIGRHSGYYNDYCLSCLVYKKGSMELLEMVVVESCSRRWKFFEKDGTEWRDIGGVEDFLNKLKVIMEGFTTLPQSFQ